MDKLSELIARLEKATGPDRNLDVAIWALSADPQKYRRVTYSPRYSDWEADSGAIWEPFYPALNAKHFTESIDDALTLLEPGWEYSISTLYGIPDVELPLNDTRISPVRVRELPCNVPTTICIAALKAKSSLPNQGTER